METLRPYILNTLQTMILGCVINTDFSEHQNIFYPSLCRSTTSLWINPTTKRRRKLNKLESHMSALPLILFPRALFSLLLFRWSKPSKLQVWFYPPHSQYSVDKVPLPILIGIYDTCDTKGIHIPVCLFPRQVLVLTKKSIKLCFCQRGIQPNITLIFWGTGRGIVDFDKQAYKDDAILFWKIRLGQTEESSLSGKTHIHTR